MAQLTTFVFTDLVGSVDLKRRMPGDDADARDAAYVERVLRPHRERIEAGLAEAEGRVVSTAGDGHFLVFPNTARAARWALALVQAHEAETDGDAAVRVRIGMHAGEPQPDPSDPDNFIGRAVDYAARLADHAQGSQVLVSRTAASLIEDGGLEGVSLHGHGAHPLKGIGEVELYELLDEGRSPSPPRRSPGESPPRDWSLLPRTMALTEYVAESGGGSTCNVATRSRPRRVGNYELGELLGAGGMGNVYKARHAQFDRPRAVKIIRPDLIDAGGDSVVQRFYQEVRATGSLEHPNLVVAIDSSSPKDGEHYLVMEYVDGVSLDLLLQQEGALPSEEACEIARQAALGLEHLHEQGLVHRDVKPSNLMLTLANSPHLPVDSGDGEGLAGRSVAAKLPVVKLMDLGLALLAPREGEDRLTQINRGGMGTGHYMPPEQWRTTSVDIRADIYSLGCTLYHLLTGEPPFVRSDLKPERAHALETPPPLETVTGAPQGLVDLVGRMLAKNPADRPQTPLEVAEALEAFASGRRLGQRIKRLQNGETLRSAGRVETRLEPADPRETNALGGRQLITPAPSTVPQKTSWLITALATVVACGAVLALAWSRGSENSEAVAAQLKIAAGAAARDFAAAIDKRIDALETVASDPSLPDLLLDADARAERLQPWLTEQRERWDAKLEFKSTSWFLTDAEGVQIARSPPSKKTLGSSYSYRDYFHGQGDGFEKGTTETKPIREPHRSTVYDSSSKPGLLKVAFSTPVYGKRAGDGPAPVLGVLAMSVSLGDFAEFDVMAEITGSVEILLIDTDVNTVNKKPWGGLVLHHQELSRHTRPSDPLRLTPELLTQIGAAVEQSPAAATVLSPYADVLGRDKRQFLGAAAVISPKTVSDGDRKPWVVLAEQPTP